MQNSRFNLGRINKLRLEAENRLKQGSVPQTRGSTLDSDTLALLFRLASDPGRADDALILLHELQTYQVELDMQHEQLESSEYELVHALNYYSTLYNYAPLGYFIINQDDRIIEVNLAGAKLLGISQGELVNMPFHGLFAPTSRLTINTLLKKVREERTGSSCAVQYLSGENSPRLLRISAELAPEDTAILLIVSV